MPRYLPKELTENARVRQETWAIFWQRFCDHFGLCMKTRARPTEEMQAAMVAWSAMPEGNNLFLRVRMEVLLRPAPAPNYPFPLFGDDDSGFLGTA